MSPLPGLNEFSSTFQGLAHGYYISRLQREKTGAHPYGALKTGALPRGRASAPL